MPVNKQNSHIQKVTKNHALFGTKYFKGQHLIDKQSIITDQCKHVVTTLSAHLSHKKLETQSKKEDKPKRSVKTLTLELGDGKKKLQTIRQSDNQKNRNLVESNRTKKS